MSRSSPLLLLFDIDGTLTSGGPAKEAFGYALRRVFGTAGPIRGHDFAGKTDPQIVRELLSGDAGVGRAVVDARLPRFWSRYVAELARRIEEQPAEVLPGVRRLVLALAGTADVRLGLVTGNVERGAMLKLGSVGLKEYFAVGGFGSDHESRNELPGVALRRAAKRWGTSFSGTDAVIIGDTPRDVECGKVLGAKTVAVATGRFSAAELAREGADAVLPDFADTRASLATIAGVVP